MRLTHVLSGLVVDDIDRATRWYADLLGRPADSVPMPSCHEWTLGPDVTLQVHQNSDVPAGQGSLALVVDDLDTAIAGTSARFGDVLEVSDFVRTATTTDPDGNHITLVQPLATRPAS